MENRRDVKVSHSASCDQWRNGNIQHRTKMGELHNLGVGQIAGGRATASRLAAQPTSNPPLTRVVRLGFPAVALPSPMSLLQFVMHNLTPLRPMAAWCIVAAFSILTARPVPEEGCATSPSADRALYGTDHSNLREQRKAGALHGVKTVWRIFIHVS